MIGVGLGGGNKWCLTPFVSTDATLRELATHRPRSTVELLGISGIGQTKADRYGEAVLDVLRAA